MRRGKTKAYLALHLLLMFYSLSTVLSKVASGLEFPSVSFVLCYGAMIGILGIYAIGWQQIIKRLPLTTAYANRAVTVAWGIVWGVVIFHEGITLLQLCGATVVLLGVVLYVTAPEDQGKGEAHEN